MIPSFQIPCLAVLIGLSGTAIAKPVGRWSFASEQATPLEIHGRIVRDQAGPRSPEFPDFSTDNTAIRFEGQGYVRIPDEFDDHRFDFANDDEITIEAWVNVAKVREGQQAYVIGKGRTGNPKFARNNQNWALRTVAHRGVIKASFLFAHNPAAVKDSDKLTKAPTSPWHRWTSELGFTQNSGWHHIAVSYRFGHPNSIRGWIDGQPTTGTWDMGGPTTLAPIVDDDDVWIGSSQGGGPGNSFTGLIDEVAVHRRLFDNQTMATRFARVGGPKLATPMDEQMPQLGTIPKGRVLFSLSEGLPSHTRWLFQGEDWPSEYERWLGSEFLLPRLPVRYDEIGIRAARKPPVLLRIAADVQLPAGTHRVLLRARSLGRLWINDKVIARTKSNPHGGGNLQPIVPIADPPFPGGRIVRFPQQEVFGEVTIEAVRTGQLPLSRVVLELVVGSSRHRMESGEICVAVASESSDLFRVLTSHGDLPLTDADVEPRLRIIEEELTNYEDQKRRSKSASQAEFWQQRHEQARDWLTAVSQPRHDRAAAKHPIDAMIAAKIAATVERAGRHDEQTTKHFHETVLPVLRSECFRCHGDKAQGGLRLDSRAAVLAAGDSELPAVVPGDPDDSELVARIRDHDMPPTEAGLTDEQIETLEDWVADGALWPQAPIDTVAITASPVISDQAFLRRTSLDLIGAPPTPTQAREFLASTRPQKRTEWIDRLLGDPAYADHWVSFWLDLLAENPTLLNVSMGSTGPFRWFLYESLKDNKPLDRMVTELIQMRGSPHHGGSAGFALAGENDSPMAAKAHVLASAFLGIDLQCARCHDSPFHSTTQEELFSLAAMLDRKPITPPKTSRVPDAFFEKQTRQSLIRVSLPLGQAVKPQWPFARFTDVEDSTELDPWMLEPDNPRNRLAALFTVPQNRRFARVLVNHFWKRLMGAGLVEPVHDWEGKQASHPELLDYLASELIQSGYNAQHVLRLIMTSDAYQREAMGQNQSAPPEQRFFASPDRRRLSAEQIVDSLFTASQREIDVEELTFLHDGTQTMGKRLTLGKPQRAWMFAGLNNERDRPSLSLPRAQEVVDVLEAFGWTGTRQKPIFQRETDPNVLQPGILANGTLTTSLSRAVYESSLAQLALDADSPHKIVDELFLRFLSRLPTATERDTFTASLAEGFADRVLPDDDVQFPQPDPPLPQSTWTNHLLPEANQIQQQWLARVRRGPPVDPRIRSEWREVYEDVVWSLINHREFVWIP